LPSDTDNFKDLDWMDGGSITGVSTPIQGVFYVFKLQRVYKGQRTGVLNDAYEFYLISTARGAMDGSVQDGIDESGNPCVYFTDPAVGPCRVGGAGIQEIEGLRQTWATVNTGAEGVATHSYYYPDKKQMHYHVATFGADFPNYELVSQTNEIRSSGQAGNAARGWSVSTGHRTEAICSCVVPEMVLDQDTGSTYLSFRPYLGFTAPDLIQRGDASSRDNGEKYLGKILTKSYIVAGLLNWFGAMSGGLLASPLTTDKTKMRISFIKDFGLEKVPVLTDFKAEGNEELIIKLFDNFGISHVHALQLLFEDVDG